MMDFLFMFHVLFRFFSSFGGSSYSCGVPPPMKPLARDSDEEQRSTQTAAAFVF
jgi:hypothetical protein